MTLVNTETGELTEPMDADAARRLTERIRIAATNYTDAKAKVLTLVDEAKAGAAHIALGYKSWTAYLSDVLSDEPLRLAREQGRPEFAARLADEGMSNAAIGEVLGVHRITVGRDLEIHESTRADAQVDEPKVRVTEGRDGRVRTSVAAGRLKEQPPSTERNHQEAELVNAITSIVRPLLNPRNVSNLSPKARQLIVERLENAITSLKGTDQ